MQQYNPPAPISFPNVEHFPPGKMLDIFGLNHDTGVFEKLGEGRVSADGRTVDSIGGVVKSNSWHGFVPPVPHETEGDPEQPPDHCDDCEEQEPVGSSVSVKSGNLSEEHRLVPYRSLGESRAQTLIYHSLLANPRPIIGIRSILGTAAPHR